jgi:uncharacterized surface protein with fasciclin (FAS1) repeats
MLLRALLALALCAHAAATASASSSAAAPPAGCGTAWDVIRSDAQFSTLASLAPSAPPPSSASPRAAGGGAAFHEQLGVSEGQPYTFFAPTNEAFARLMMKNATTAKSGQPAAALPRDAAALGSLIRYHIVPGRTLLAASLTSGERLNTALPGAPPLLVARTSGGAVAIQAQGSNATVTKADVATCHGVLHAIDNVLLPQR